MTPPAASPARSTPPAGGVRVRIWDLPTRLFHGLLAAAVIGVLVTGWTGVMDWHFRLGYAVMALLLFRLVWGVVGGRWSRFSAFVHRPRSVAAYLRGQAHPDHLIGHNPLGALSVFAMLAILMLQVATGLVSDDAITYAGPLAHTVSGALSGLATYWHAVWGKWVVIGLIVLHLAAVLYYAAVRRQRLVAPMITGDKVFPPDTAIAPSRDVAGSRWLALALFAGCVAVVGWISSIRP
ncbi:cytochrome b/b6 domain-containing protein [Variovorax sp. LT1P1]|uniref:cytochrome b/b6 domain-containing protein n=1 Tax=Variovorax sp. LT1P1 TaxID=3443730 RepID=UPI003F44EB13